MRAVFLLAVGIVAAFGQRAAITGEVFDGQTAAPVEYANVVLYRQADRSQVTGTTTRADGRFELLNIEPGRYYLEVSFIGFRTETVGEVEVASGAKLDLGRLKLEQVAVEMKGVEAAAEKPAITYEVDKKVIEVSKLPNAAGGTAVDALQNVPAVKVDIEGNVTLRGSSNFKVLVDGKPTLLEPNEALKQTPASTIDRIEVITNPSARYEPDGAAGIINLLLKKQKGSGLSSLLNANSSFVKNRYGGDGLVSYRQGIASAYVGGNLGRRASSHTSESETRRFTSAETLSVTGQGRSEWGSLYGSGRAGAEFQLGPMDKSSVSGRFGGFDGSGSGRSDETETLRPQDSSRQYASDWGRQFVRSFQFVTADHEHLFDTTGHKLVARGFWVNRPGTDISRNAQLDSTETTASGRRSEEQGPMGRLNLDLEYSLPARDEDKLEAGLQGRFEGADQDFQVFQYDTLAQTYKLDERSSHPYAGTQTVYAVFGTYTWNRNALGVQPGLRGEYGRRMIEVRDTTQTWEVKRWDYFPSLHVTLTLPAGRQLTASYSRRIDRPDPWYLRPFPVWFDLHTVGQGNPELRPAYTNSWELGCELPFSGNSLTAEAYYRTSSDMYEWITVKYPADSTVLLQTARNIGSDRSVGTEFAANLSPFQWFTAYLSADVYYYREQGELEGQTVDRTEYCWSGSANLTFRLPTSTQVQLNGDFSSPYFTATTTGSSWFGADAAVKQSLWNRALSITLRVSNLFGPHTRKSTSEGPGFSSRSSSISEGRILTLAVSYNLNNFRFDPKMRAGEGIEQEGTQRP